LPKFNMAFKARGARVPDKAAEQGRQTLRRLA